MARRNDFFRTPILSFAQQIGSMLRAHPIFQAKLRRSLVSWTGDLKPTAMSETYTVRIDYPLRRRPTVWVLKPQLRGLTPEGKIKHTFADGSVCLHLHEDWTAAMFISETIVPWLLLWLYHYESWHATGNWLGGGHEPQGGK